MQIPQAWRESAAETSCDDDSREGSGTLSRKCRAEAPEFTHTETRTHAHTHFPYLLIKPTATHLELGAAQLNPLSESQVKP